MPGPRVKRLLQAILTPRPRHALHHAWIWLCVGVAMVVVGVSCAAPKGGGSSGGSYTLFLTPSGLVVGQSYAPADTLETWIAKLGMSYDATRWSGRYDVTITVTRFDRRYRQLPPATPEQIRQTSRALGEWLGPEENATVYPGQLLRRRAAEHWYDMMIDGRTKHVWRHPNEYVFLILRSLGYAVIWSAIAVLILRGIMTWRYQRVLTVTRAGRCPRCAYVRTSNPTNLCPECGTDIRAIAYEAATQLGRTTPSQTDHT